MTRLRSFFGLAAAGGILLAVSYFYHKGGRANMELQANEVRVVADERDGSMSSRRDLLGSVNMAKNQREALNAIENGILAQEDSAFDLALTLDSVCAPVVHQKWEQLNEKNPAAGKLRAYCKGYSGLIGDVTSAKGLEDQKAIYEHSLEARVRSRLADMESEYGRHAVEDDLDNIIRRGDSIEIKAALQFASEQDIVPTSWRDKLVNLDYSMISRSQVTNTASLLALCYHSNSCTEGSLYSMQLCMATNACDARMSYLQAVKRGTPPIAFDLAKELLAGN
jgi:hypothetical protein